MQKCQHTNYHNTNNNSMYLPWLELLLSCNIYMLEKFCNTLNFSLYIYIYIHYLHFFYYCPHLCRHVYHNVSAVAHCELLQAVGTSNLTLYFAYQGRLSYFHEPCLMDVSYQLSPVYMYKNGFSINYIQWLMCQITKPNQILSPPSHMLNSTITVFLLILNTFSAPKFTDYNSKHHDYPMSLPKIKKHKPIKTNKSDSQLNAIMVKRNSKPSRCT